MAYSAGPGMQQHHILPREFANEFADIGIDVHQYCVDLSVEKHNEIHNDLISKYYNETIQEKFDEWEEAKETGNPMTREELLADIKEFAEEHHAAYDVNLKEEWIHEYRSEKTTLLDEMLTEVTLEDVERVDQEAMDLSESADANEGPAELSDSNLSEVEMETTEALEDVDDLDGLTESAQPEVNTLEEADDLDAATEATDPEGCQDVDVLADQPEMETTVALEDVDDLDGLPDGAQPEAGTLEETDDLDGATEASNLEGYDDVDDLADGYESEVSDYEPNESIDSGPSSLDYDGGDSGGDGDGGGGD